MLNYLTLSNLIAVLKIVLDVGVVSIIIYYCLKIVKNNSRTVQLVKGILFVLLINWIAQTLGLRTIAFITTQVLNWGVLVIFIIFQPEVRSLLEKLGKTTFTSISSLNQSEKERLIDELVRSTNDLANSKTGALICLEQTNSLDDYIATGTALDADVSDELLGTIFWEGTPLHDGAVIIRGNRIACASAFFPPTTREFPRQYGARHRAAVGISEVTDSITIVVSEETGNVSIAKEGVLTQVNAVNLRATLVRALQASDPVVSTTTSETQQAPASSAQDVPIKEVKPLIKKRSRKKDAKIEAEAIVVQPSTPLKENTKEGKAKGGKTNAKK
ncbi:MULTISPECIES: diadenylate cyclase CdaA [unclassified Breznakia]|uniref:diadenylate cyclase CdaA n=1 Tax=unclassified Breznakia TaxID=2623764 RepID=UPI0024760769|nr:MULTISPECIES: diadenylate cyclase CdaA [unclassified Breznakia]MDH6367826.1 uncharacterized protein (TIGR00159 family) [Breznakia sp. PH1-1]MDH6404927.1 uncharacterized protein (TIGR00159 family) [Breznakia sp. PF1-11]MDH6412629.1 uncharacterized protein (TIGR00159 family) [Breznakia sp. PFB1-11]MDH6415002.1 uncharacterized protein (TIGR00159 family) [Breznakia sp. PFB1-14]MDH6417313.1 uncharacterized protein (TIGR00159 family) [Breznakia sp. PFB1-4]